MKMNARSALTLAIYVAAKLTMGLLWHLVLFKEALAAATPFARSEPIIGLGLAAMVVQGILLMWLYPRFHRPESPKRSGMLFGSCAGLFLAAGAIWVEVAKFQFADGARYLMIETVYEVFSFTVLGLVLSLRHDNLRSADLPSLARNGAHPRA